MLLIIYKAQKIWPSDILIAFFNKIYKKYMQQIVISEGFSQASHDGLL